MARGTDTDQDDDRRSLRPRDTCSCGMHIPPRGVTPSAAWRAEHDWTHRIAQRLERQMRAAPDTRRDLTALVAAAAVWIKELRRQRSDLTAERNELRDRVAELVAAVEAPARPAPVVDRQPELFPDAS